MKKSIIFFLGTLMLLSFSAFSQDIFLCGDVNSDGEVDILDALTITKYYIGLPVTIDLSVADVNGDGEIDIEDALLVSFFYIGYISELNCPVPTPAPTPDPTPEPGIDLSGTWVLDSHVNLTLLEDQIIYDHTIEEWTSEVIISGYINDTITPDVEIRRIYQPPGWSTYVTLTTDPAIYPNYEIVLSFTDHISFTLMRVQATVAIDEDTVTEFSVINMQGIPFTWQPNWISVPNTGTLSSDGGETLALSIELNRVKTLALSAGTLYKLSYPAYDEITDIRIYDDTFRASFIVGGDVMITINGTVEINEPMVILDFQPNSYVQPPMTFEMLYGDDDTISLLRDTPSPSSNTICTYYGIDPAFLESFDHNQLFILE